LKKNKISFYGQTPTCKMFDDEQKKLE